MGMMSVDGWSSPLTQSVLGVTLGQDFAMAVDCQGKAHTSENLLAMVNRALDACEQVHHLDPPSTNPMYHALSTGISDD